MSPSLRATLLQGAEGGAHISKTQAVAVAVALLLAWRVGVVIYRLFFHPLAKYPGPRLFAASNFPFIWKANATGKLTMDSLALHKQYGPIVRIAPNYLAVDGAIAFPQIFQHRPGRPEWQKQRGFYHDHDELSLIGGTDDVHRRLRRQLAYAFSDSSMYEQEPVVTRYIDQLVGRLGERAADGGVFNLVHWFNFTTFDIIGDLMFADSFHSLDGGDYHPWVLNIVRGARGVALRRVMKLYPFMKAIISGSDIKRDDEIQQMAAEKAMARKAQGETPGGRRDFMTYMLKKNRDGGAGFSDFEIIMNSPLLVNAGSETTATTLTSLFYHLGKKENRAVYEHLTKEIREAFQNKDDIDMKTTNPLPYLHAVIEEALRIYPPAAETPPRVSPGAEVDGKFIPKGTVVVVYQLATYRNPANFAEPNAFRPERWLPATHPLYDPRFAGDNRACFRPFSFGTRDCLGKNLAYSELRVAVARILLRFDYELAAGQEDQDWIDKGRVFVIWEKPALNVRFVDRQRITEK